jgi:hypothetical protein
VTSSPAASSWIYDLEVINFIIISAANMINTDTTGHREEASGRKGSSR